MTEHISKSKPSPPELPRKHSLYLNSLKALIKNYLTKWRIAFLFFIIIYVYLITLELGFSVIQWDETNHLNGGLLLLQGNFASYLESNVFYPPMSDLFTMISFGIAGPSVFAGRLVSVVFSLLSIYVVFEFTYRTYGPKTALLSSALLSIMPGYIYISRLALTDTTAIFFLTTSLVLFFSWIQKRNNLSLVFSGLCLGIAFLTKYQMLVGTIIMTAALFLCFRENLRWKLKRFPLIIVTVVIIASLWFLCTYQIYASGMLGQWKFALTVGNAERLFYDTGIGRFPQWFLECPNWFQLPLFYGLEMVIPYFDTYPISLGFYLLGVGGLFLFASRRNPSDKMLLIWFVVAYVFFSLIPNKQWRYMALAFPVLAIAASSLFVTAFEKVQQTLKSKFAGLNKKRMAKVGAVLLVAFFAMSTMITIRDAHFMIAKDWVHIPIEEASVSLAERLKPNDTIMLLCSQNMFNDEMILFNLNRLGKQNQVMHYPYEPIDAFKPDFNTTKLVEICKQYNIKYILILENEQKLPYFDPTINSNDVLSMLYSSSNEGNFSQISKETTIGSYPHRIYIITFAG